MEKNVLFNPSEVKHQEIIEKLVTESSPRRVFLMMIMLASVIATLGLLNDSAAIVIGAMLVAPLLWPVLGISMGLLVRNWRMIRIASASVVFSLILAVLIAIIITFFYVPLGTSSEILRQTDVWFMLPVAIAAGAAAAFAITYDSVKEVVPGIAISVALLPPLVTIGIGLGGTDWELMRRSIQLFFMNLAGIVVTSWFVFFALGFHKFRHEAESASKKEEKVLKKT